MKIRIIIFLFCIFSVFSSCKKSEKSVEIKEETETSSLRELDIKKLTFWTV